MTVRSLIRYAYHIQDFQLAEKECTADCGASVFTALQEQLGLKLESTRDPTSVLVIDRLERPTPD